MARDQGPAVVKEQPADAYAAYIAGRHRGMRGRRSSAWSVVRQVLIGLSYTLAYASFAIPIVGGFLSVPFFAIGAFLTLRRDRARQRLRR